MKKIISLILACCIVAGVLPLTVFASIDDESAMSDDAINSVSIWSGSVADSFSGGSGTKNDPYQVSTAAELAYLAKSVNEGNTYSGQYIIQKTNIDLSNISWTPIGNETTAFSGYYNGNNLNIANMSISRATSYNGLFGNSSGVISNITMKSCTLSKVDHSGFVAGMNIGTIQNCHIVNCRITNASSYIGGIAGESYSKILNCTVRSTEILGTSSVGGLVGYLGAISLVPRYNLINNCSAINSTISGDSKIGGLCGEKGPNFTSAGGFTTDIINSHNIGTTVTSIDDYAGGILGYARNFYTGDKIYFSQCSNSGNISANNYGGGILGTESSFIGNGITDFTNCYNTGNIVSQKAYAGGICGHSSDTFSNCHNIGMVSALSYANGICGNPKGSSYSKTWLATMNNCYCLYTATSDSIATTLSYTKFLEESSFVNWDFNNIWIMNSAVGGPILREMLDTLPEAYSNVKIIDFETLMPIANVTISSETRNNIICTSDENGMCKFSGNGFLFSLYFPMYVEKDGYKPLECCLIDFVANFENEYIEENIIFLIPEWSDQIYDPISLTIKNHMYYIYTKLEQLQQLGFYENVWNNEELGRDKYKETAFEVYSAIDILCKIISFDIPGIVSEVKAEADFYEAFISDIAIQVANQIPEDQINATFLKNSNTTLRNLYNLFDAYAKTEEFNKSLTDAAQAKIKDFKPTILTTAFCKKVTENAKKLLEDPLGVDENYRSIAEAVVGDFFKNNEGAITKVFTFGGVGLKVVNYINDATDLVNAFHKANNAYLSAICIRTISDELFDTIESVCQELEFTDSQNAKKIREVCKKLKARSEQSDADLYEDCLDENMGEAAFKILYSKFVRSAVKRTVQVGIVRLLYEDEFISFDDAISFVDNLNKQTTVFTVAFSLLDLCFSGSQKVDSYFQLEMIGEFEKAFLSVIQKKKDSVIQGEDLAAVQDFEIAFKYWKEVNQYAYKTCYTYNEKYASQMLGITWGDEERKEALENMSGLREYWIGSECHYHVVRPHTHTPRDNVSGYTSQVCATCKTTLPQPQGGDCGYNLTWTLSDDGELVISGTGAMWDYSYYSVPWYYNRNSINKVTISDGVTTIGNHAFHSCTNLESVNISDSVITIADYAFFGCGLTNITIPNSVTALGMSAFSACRRLTNITFSDSLTTIGESAFSSCDSLTSISIPNKISSIGNYAFYGCDSLVSITIPNNITSIGIEAFISTGYYNDSNNWENDILYIDNCFISARNTIKDCVIKNGIRIIGKGAFYYCYSLTNVTIPESMKFIPNGAFSECDELRNATFYSHDVEFGTEVFIDIWGDPIQNLEIHGYTGSTAEAYASENGHTFVPLNETVPEPDDEITVSGTIGALTWELTSAGEMTITGDGVLTDITANTPWYEHRNTITTVTIGEGVTDIDNIAFFNCKNLTTINVDAANPNYTSIDGVLYSKDGKTIVCYPAGKTDTAYTIPEGTTAITGYTFRTCKNLVSVTIPDSVTSIGNYAFWGCKGIENITLGKGVSEIGTWTFAYCDSLTEIEVDAENASYISVDNVLYTKDMKTLVAYPAGKTDTSYTIPEGVTRILNYAFSGCTRLVSVTIPASMKTVGNCVFDDCRNLTSITVADGNKRYIDLDGVLYSGDMATLLYYPAGKTAAEFTVPETVTSIGRYAFSDCDNLVTVNVGTNVASIGYSAFSYCDKLTAINYAGTEAEWNTIPKGNYWNRYLDGDEVKFSSLS